MSRAVWILPALALAAACRSGATPYRYPADPHHPSHVKRSRAPSDCANEGSDEDMAPAFRLLRDEDGGIRTVAWQALRARMPGEEDFGYRPYLPEDVRAGIAQRWEAWWRKGGAAEDASVGEGCGG